MPADQHLTDAEPCVSRAWRLLLLPAGLRLLEVSADAGGRARLATESGAVVTCGRLEPAQADALRAAGQDALHLAVPTPAERFDAAWVSVSLGRTRGGEAITRDLGATLALVAPHVRPGGALVVSLPGPAFGLPGMAKLRARVLREAPPQGSASGPWRILPPTCAGVTRAAESAGFERVRCFAALPHSARPKFLVPLGDPMTAGFFFGRLSPRPRSLLGRGALLLAEAVAGLGLLGVAAPSWEVLARRAGDR